VSRKHSFCTDLVQVVEVVKLSTSSLVANLIAHAGTCMLSTRIFLCSTQVAGRSECMTRFPFFACQVRMMMMHIVHCRSPFPAILRPAQTLPNHPEFPNVRHFPHPRCTPYASRKGFRVSQQRVTEVYHASCPQSSTDRLCCVANGQASIPHLVLLAPFPLSEQLDLARMFVPNASQFESTRSRSWVIGHHYS
jgi:hypothetical protein